MATTPPSQGELFPRPDHRDDYGYSANDVRELAGVSYRQLDYWTRTGLVAASAAPAHGSGNHRRYEFRDLLEVKIIASLLETGLSLQKVRSAVEQLHKIGVNELSDATLICDGQTVFYCQDIEQITDLLTGGRSIFGLAIPRLVEELTSKIMRLPTPDTPRRQRGRVHRSA